MMADRDNQVITYVSDAEKAQIKEWADETGKSVSQLAREAIMEYVDHDRTARMDEKLDRVLALLEDGEHTHTDSDASTSTEGEASPTVKRARKIARRIYDNHSSPIPDHDVERAIEDIAGAENRTLDKYKDILKKRGLLYEHPSDSSVWTDQRSEWAVWVADYVDATPTAEIIDYAENYGLESDEFELALAEATR